MIELVLWSTVAVFLGLAILFRPIVHAAFGVAVIAGFGLLYVSPWLYLWTVVVPVVVFLVASFPSLKAEPDPTFEPILRRNKDGKLVVSWPYPGTYNLHVLADLSRESRQNVGAPAAVVKGRDSVRVVTIGLQIPGRAFILARAVADDAEALASPWHDTVWGERTAPLKGMRNFRDLGGYRTRDGKRVKWGQLFRGDHMKGLKASDLQFFQENIKLRTLVDLRLENEKKDKPNQLPKPAPRVLELDILKGETSLFDPAQVLHQIQQAKWDGIDSTANMTNMMAETARRNAGRYKPMFDALLAGAASPEGVGAPLMLHCTAGKDRTGVGSALLLLALGVEKESVLHDYLLSNVQLHKIMSIMLWGGRNVSLGHNPYDQLFALFFVKRQYMEAIFKVVNEWEGGEAAFFEHHLGLTPERRARLQELLLE